MLRLRVPLIIVGGTFAFARGGYVAERMVGGFFLFSVELNLSC